MQAVQVPFLGQEDALEKGTAALSSTVAWVIAWTEEPGRLQSMGSQKESDTTKRLKDDNILCWVYTRSRLAGVCDNSVYEEQANFLW